MSSTQRVMVSCLGAALLIFLGFLTIRYLQPEPVSILKPEEGTYFSAPRDIKQFHLVDTENKPFDGKNLMGKFSVVFFGFTHCNQICPATLFKLSELMQIMETKKQPVQIIFITLDPETDTPAQLKKYLKPFHPKLIALSGKLSEIRKLQSQLGVYSTPNPHAKAGEDRLLHSTSLLVITPNAKWTGKLNGEISPKVWAEAIIRMMDRMNKE